MRIGDVLLSEGVITPEKLDMALELQKEKKKRLGEILVTEGFVCLLYTSDAADD